MIIIEDIKEIIDEDMAKEISTLKSENSKLKQEVYKFRILMQEIKEETEKIALLLNLKRELLSDESKKSKSNEKIELNYLLESGEDFLLKLDNIKNKNRNY